MEPTIRLNDKMDVDDEESFEEVKIGDIIAFKAPDPVEENKIVVHRVTAIIQNGNNLTGNVILCMPISIDEVIYEKTILTKGDANECSIPGIDFPVTKENYIGKVQHVYNSLGLKKHIGNNNDTNWTSYSNTTHGISFQYPKNWKLEYDNMNQSSIILSNLPNTNTIVISILNKTDGLDLGNSSLLEFVKKNITDTFGVIVIDPFVEKNVNDTPSVVGRISEEKLVNDRIENNVKDIILLNYTNAIYKLVYIDSIDNYDENIRDEVWKRFVLSFNIFQ
jgi:hypothetical protein